MVLPAQHTLNIITELATFALHDVSDSSTGASTPTEAPPRAMPSGFALTDLPSSGASTPTAVAPRAVAGYPLQLGSNTTSGASSPAPPARAAVLTTVGEGFRGQQGPTAFAISDASGSESGGDGGDCECF